MIFPWIRKREDGDRESLDAIERAVEGRDRARDRWPEIRDLTGQLSHGLDRNHLGEAIYRALRGGT